MGPGRARIQRTPVAPWVQPNSASARRPPYRGAGSGPSTPQEVAAARGARRPLRGPTLDPSPAHGWHRVEAQRRRAPAASSIEAPPSRDPPHAGPISTSRATTCSRTTALSQASSTGAMRPLATPRQTSASASPCSPRATGTPSSRDSAGLDCRPLRGLVPRRSTTRRCLALSPDKTDVAAGWLALRALGVAQHHRVASRKHRAETVRWPYEYGSRANLRGTPCGHHRLRPTRRRRGPRARRRPAHAQTRGAHRRRPRGRGSRAGVAVFMPLTRVTSINPGQVICTGVVNLRRFQARASETLAIGELFERSVTLKAGRTVAYIEDIAIEQGRGRVWQVTKLYVRSGERRRGVLGFSRKGASSVVDLDEVTGLATRDKVQGAALVIESFADYKPADLAAALMEMSPARSAEIAGALDNERLADVLEELPEEDQVALLSTLRRDRAADVLEAMDPDDAADLLGDLPASEAAELLELMEPEDARQVRQLLGYEDDTAGGLMTTEPVIVGPETTVATCLALVRNAGASPRARLDGVRRAPAARDSHRTIHRPRPPAAAAARGPPRQRRQLRGPRDRLARAHRPPRRGRPPHGRLRHPCAARRRRGQPPAWRDLHRRRARPPAAARLARTRRGRPSGPRNRPRTGARRSAGGADG